MREEGETDKYLVVDRIYIATPEREYSLQEGVRLVMQ
jgi:hypothetical protein